MSSIFSYSMFNKNCIQQVATALAIFELEQFFDFVNVNQIMHFLDQNNLLLPLAKENEENSLDVIYKNGNTHFHMDGSRCSFRTFVYVRPPTGKSSSSIPAKYFSFMGRAPKLFKRNERTKPKAYRIEAKDLHEYILKSKLDHKAKTATLEYIRYIQSKKSSNTTKRKLCFFIDDQSFEKRKRIVHSSTAIIEPTNKIKNKENITREIIQPQHTFRYFIICILPGFPKSCKGRSAIDDYLINGNFFFATAFTQNDRLDHEAFKECKIRLHPDRNLSYDANNMFLPMETSFKYVEEQLVDTNLVEIYKDIIFYYYLGYINDDECSIEIRNLMEDYRIYPRIPIFKRL